MMTGDEKQLIRKLRHPDHKTVIQVLGELRERGLLFDGSLRRMDLRCAHLRGADLAGADLQGADLRQADLRDTDLSKADLTGARMNRANLRGTHLAGAILQGADLFHTDLEEVVDLSAEQLTQANRLRAAIMPDGGRYDGRYNLRGDLKDSKVIHIDPADAEEMADFYRVPVEDYRRGQAWAENYLADITRAIEMEAPGPHMQHVVGLRSEDNQVVLAAIEALRDGGWLDTGLLKGMELRGACLMGARLSLTSMEGADLSEANLEAADLSVVNFQQACLRRANLKRANLLWTSLHSADLTDAVLHEADLTGANLRNARLENADLQGANLCAVNLKRADLKGANLRGVCNLREEEMSRVYRLQGATMPDGSRYDGRFDLPGDEELVAVSAGETGR
jgi:uncharacterized protein YjbI with pentapeptide repeats